MQKIGRFGVRKRRKSIPPAYHTPKNRPSGVRTPNSKSLTEALSSRCPIRRLSLFFSLRPVYLAPVRVNFAYRSYSRATCRRVCLYGCIDRTTLCIDVTAWRAKRRRSIITGLQEVRSIPLAERDQSYRIDTGIVVTMTSSSVIFNRQSSDVSHILWSRSQSFYNDRRWVVV